MPKMHFNGIPIPFQVSDGDFDTNIYVDKTAVDDDIIRFDVGGTTDVLKITTSEFVWNDAGDRLDFRVETDDDVNALNISGTNDCVAMGTSNHTLTINGLTVVPKLHVLDGAGDSNISFITRSASDVATQGAFCVFARSRGTDGSQTVVQNGDRIGVFRADAHDGTQYVTGASMSFIVDAVPITGNIATQIRWSTDDGSSGVLDRMALDSNGNLGVGTTAPFTTLDVRGDAIFNFDKGDNDFLVYGQGSGAAIFLDAGNARLRFGDASNGDLLELWTTKTEFNRSNGNIDFTVHSQTEQIFFMDASTSGIAINASSTSNTISGAGLFTKVGIHNTSAGSDEIDLGLFRHDNVGAGFAPLLLTGRARGTTSTPAIVQDGDTVFTLLTTGHDGTDYEQLGRIDFQVDGAPGAGDMPGRIVFKTTADGASATTEALRIDSTQTSRFSGNANPFTNGGSSLGVSGTAWSELYLDSSGKIDFNNGDITLIHRTNELEMRGGTFRQEGTDLTQTSFYQDRYSANAFAANQFFRKSRGAIDSQTIVQDVDAIGITRYYGSDGSAFIEGAQLGVSVDGTPALGDVPMNFFFKTQASGGSLTTKVLITDTGELVVGDGVTDGDAHIEIVTAKDSSTTNDMANYHLGIRNSNNTTNAKTGIAFNISSVADNIGAAIMHERVGSNDQGTLEFYTKSSTSGSVAPDLAMIIDQNQSVGLGGITAPTAGLHLSAGTTTRAPFKLTSGTNLTSAETGAMEYDGDALYFTPAGQRRAVTLSNGTITSSTSVSNTVTETTVFTETISANELHTNQKIIIDIQGRYSTVNATDTFTARLKIAGTTVATVVSDAANVTDAPLDIQFIFTVRSEGVTGSVWANTRAVFNNVNKHTASTSATTIDTTSAADATLTVQWSNADAGNIVSVDQGGGEYNL